MANSILGLIYSLFGEKYVERRRNEVAKRAREAILQISYYREKLRKNSIDESIVKDINNIEKLDRFLEKYGNILAPKSEDLIGRNFSFHLSLVEDRKRIWVQSSSGYTSIERIRREDSLMDMAAKFKRKEVAYTLNDIKRVLSELYIPGLKRLFSDFYKTDRIPTLAIFTRLFGLVSGSGIYPLVSLSMIQEKLPTRILYYGEPLDGRLADYLPHSIENNANGIFVSPAILHEIGSFAEQHNLRYKNLRFVSVGGFMPSKKTIEMAHQIGAELFIDGYGVQEVMPLGAIASGILSSENKNFLPMDGLMVYGTLIHVRIVDKNGENVSEGEKGEVRVTSVFEGTTLIDYSPGDITKLLSYKSEVNFGNYSLLLPFPLISWEIRRKDENNIVKVREYPFYVEKIEDILRAYVGYEYSIIIPQSRDKIYIIIPDSIDLKAMREIEEKIYFFIDPAYRQINIIEFHRISRDKIKELIYPFSHHKPHNVIKDRDIDIKEILGEKVLI